MKYLQIIQYVYLFFGLFFLVDAFMKFRKGETFWMSILLGIVAIGMFFFRKHFHNKQKGR